MFSRQFLPIIIFALYGRLIDSFNSDCLQGPDYWCLNQTTEVFCQFQTKDIGVCGYSNKRCPVKTGDKFCSSSSSKDFDGGLTGSDETLFSYYMLSLYWPPSSCPPIYNETLDFRRYFCSPFTDRGQPGSERLVLHGLWPTFATHGNYQGWPQFCSTTTADWSKCHINGNLCPWSNASATGFTQDDYEYCLAAEGIDQCLVNGTEILLPEQDRLKIFAPGYLNHRNLFINHEWTKHGSCSSSIFQNNISRYLTTMLDFVKKVTEPGSLTDKYIQQYVGQKISLTYLINSLNQTAIINCNEKCELEEVWMCVGRNPSTGLPDQLISCPLGARFASDSCRKARCEYVFIPLRQFPPLFSKIGLVGLKIIFLLILFKYVFLFLSIFYEIFFGHR